MSDDPSGGHTSPTAPAVLISDRQSAPVDVDALASLARRTATTAASSPSRVSGRSTRSAGPPMRKVVSWAIGAIGRLDVRVRDVTDPAAVAISSNSTVVTPGLPAAAVEACLAGDEERAKALAPSGYGAAYAVSKLALARWVRRNAITDEWIGAGIRLNAIAPGVIETPLTAPIKAVPEWYAAYANKNPMRRWGHADEMAGPTVFLLSDAASYVTGTILYADGGWLAADGRFTPPGI